jgi:hypothetical protein
MLILHLLVGGFACAVPSVWVCICYAMLIWCSCSVSAGPAGAAVGFEAAALVLLLAVGCAVVTPSFGVSAVFLLRLCSSNQLLMLLR